MTLTDTGGITGPAVAKVLQSCEGTLTSTASPSDSLCLFVGFGLERLHHYADQFVPRTLDLSHPRRRRHGPPRGNRRGSLRDRVQCSLGRFSVCHGRAIYLATAGLGTARPGRVKIALTRPRGTRPFRSAVLPQSEREDGDDTNSSSASSGLLPLAPPLIRLQAASSSGCNRGDGNGSNISRYADPEASP